MEVTKGMVGLDKKAEVIRLKNEGESNRGVARLTGIINSLDDAQIYAESRIQKLNEKSFIEEEKRHLKPYMPPLELAQIVNAKVDKTSQISVDSVKYSVLETLVGQTVVVKKYHDEIRIFYQNNEICRHRRAFGKKADKQTAGH